MDKFLTRNRLTGLALLAVALFYGYMTLQLGDNSNAKDPGAKLFPMIACVGLACCSLVILFQKTKDEKPFFTKQGWLDIGLLTAMMAAYVFLLKHAGFLISSTLLLLGTSSMFVRGKNVSLAKRIIFSVCVPIILYTVFVKLLNTRLPQGILYF